MRFNRFRQRHAHLQRYGEQHYSYDRHCQHEDQHDRKRDCIINALLLYILLLDVILFCIIMFRIVYYSRSRSMAHSWFER